MLVLTRKAGESLILSHGIKITVIEIKGRQVRIGIEAPLSVTVHREELWERISTENRTAAALSPLTLTSVKELWKRQQSASKEQEP
ncbi:MAG: carbon storage regulator CsrA [Nitrospinae bacterium]|nr:carbon storage regulator CsrA [Nitrospinota bacterium]